MTHTCLRILTKSSSRMSLEATQTPMSPALRISSVEDVDLDCDLDGDLGTDIDVEDQIQLLGGTVHPPEYY